MNETSVGLHRPSTWQRLMIFPSMTEAKIFLIKLIKMFLIFEVETGDKHLNRLQSRI